MYWGVLHCVITNTVEFSEIRVQKSQKKRRENQPPCLRLARWTWKNKVKKRIHDNSKRNFLIKGKLLYKSNIDEVNTQFFLLRT